MKVRYLGIDNPIGLRQGKTYEVVSILHASNGIHESAYYRIVDETDEDYLYYSENFEIVDNKPYSPVVEWHAE